MTAVERAVKVLDVLAEAAGPVRFCHIQDALGGISQTTVTRILKRLVAAEAIQKVDGQGYCLAGKVLTWAAAVSAPRDLRDLARPHLVALHAELRVTAALATVRAGQHISLERVEEPDMPSLAAPGRTRPNVAPLMGSMFFATPEQLADEAFFPAVFNGRALESTRAEQEEYCRRALAEDLAIDRGYFSRWTGKMAAPVRQRTRIVACLCIAYPLARWEGEAGFARGAQARLRAAAQALSAQLDPLPVLSAG